MMNHVYLFGSKTCVKCKEIKNFLSAWFSENKPKGIEYSYFDAFEGKNQDFCDTHNVDTLPHIKIYQKDKLVYEEIDFISEETVKLILNTLKNEK